MEYFDFSVLGPPEDFLLELTDAADDGRWVQLMVTPHGKALWNFAGFSSADEAIEWARAAA